MPWVRIYSRVGDSDHSDIGVEVDIWDKSIASGKTSSDQDMFGQWDISVVEVVVMVGFGLRGWGWAWEREKVVAGIDGVASDY